MKKLLCASLMMLSMCTIFLQAQTLKTPSPSPLQVIKQDFALSFIEISYSRPDMKGRQIFGKLVPFGEMWRTGANKATRVSFGEDVKVGGNAIKAGDYALYTIPNKDEWEVILNKGVNNGGTAGYKKEEDVVRFKVKPMSIHESVRTFTIQIENVSSSACEIHIMWDKIAISIPVLADIDSKIMTQIDDALNKDNKPYFQSANYYYENGKDLKQALTWVNKSIEANPDAFWMLHLKAKIQAKSGDKFGATESAKKSIELAKKANNNDYVRLNEDLIAGLK